MLSEVDVRNSSGTLLVTLPVSRVGTNVPYLITNIDGLEPVKADLSYIRNAGQSGGKVRSARIGSRNIVMNIEYRPDYAQNHTIQDLRREMYKYFPPGEEVILRLLINNSPDMEIRGTVETCDPDIFSADPAIQVTVFCPNASFLGLAQVTMSAMNDQKIFPPTQLGTDKTGFVMELTVTRTLPLVKLKNGVQPDIVYYRELIAGDKFAVSTVPGNKYVRVTRSGNTTPDFDGIQSGTLDMILSPNIPEFWVNAGGAQDQLYEVKFTPKYLGI